jgi:hypothetical protein
MDRLQKKLEKIGSDPKSTAKAVGVKPTALFILMKPETRLKIKMR